ncbi:MAG TPA: hypothetical protein VMW10_08710 [Alphaproteobacteria bacterium]|nr:hypothetical protein [Alphaproteobacteria bacterium]
MPNVDMVSRNGMRFVEVVENRAYVVTQDRQIIYVVQREEEGRWVAKDLSGNQYGSVHSFRTDLFEYLVKSSEINCS